MKTCTHPALDWGQTLVGSHPAGGRQGESFHGGWWSHTATPPRGCWETRCHWPMTQTVLLWWAALWALSTVLCRGYLHHCHNPLLRPLPPPGQVPGAQDVPVLDPACAPGGFVNSCDVRAPPQALALARLEVALDAPPPPPPSGPIRRRCAKDEEQIKARYSEQNDIRYRKIKWPSQRQQAARSVITDVQSKSRHAHSHTNAFMQISIPCAALRLDLDVPRLTASVWSPPAPPSLSSCHARLPPSPSLGLWGASAVHCP